MPEKQARKEKVLFLILICIGLAPVLAGGCSLHRPSSVRSGFEEANDYFNRGYYEASLARYERIRKEHPSMTDRVLFEMGILHTHPQNEKKDEQKAIESFQELVRGYPDSPFRQNSQAMIVALQTGTLKDRTIETQQTRIEALQQEMKGKENKISALKNQIEALQRKHFAFVLENGSADRILVEKQERRMTLFSKGEVLKTYSIALGGDPTGPKEREGDNKTPEGLYTIDARNLDSSYHLALRISYPNERDRQRAKELGVSPGGEIMIHGLKKGFSQVGEAHAEVDWTQGCIAVTDEEIEEIEKLTPNGTVVEILP